jgi:peptidoglycan/LPS O-acetylase OafA/YrhL
MALDIFFLLSAYLVTTLLLQEMDRTGTVDAGSFYARRILRIWPVYFFFLLSTLSLKLFTSLARPAPTASARVTLRWQAPEIDPTSPAARE